MKIIEDKRMVILDYYYISSTYPFVDIYLKKPAHSLFGDWPFLLVNIQFTDR